MPKSKITPKFAIVFVSSAFAIMTTQSLAQISNDGSPISGDTSIDTSQAGSVAKSWSGQQSASEPVPSEGLSRLPLTTPEVMPFEDTTGVANPAEEPGTTNKSKVGKQAYGTAAEKWPYTTTRVAISGKPMPATIAVQVPVIDKPYRQTGKLWMRFGSSWFVCTASLIKKGVLITAAHCVHNYGQQGSGFADEIRWYPGNTWSGGGPWGYFQGVVWRIPSPYYNGTDTCQTSADGVVCNNDIATVTLAPKSGLYPGQHLGGWYGYGWNLWGFVISPAFGNARIIALHQLGYPAAFDAGYQMQRTTSFGKYITSTSTTNGQLLKNTQLGSAQTGGSSGGPWLANFGTRPTITGSASLGIQTENNIVMGVTSWGYTTVGVNVQGASQFGQNAEYPNANYGGHGAGNIGSIVNDTCTSSPAYC